MTSLPSRESYKTTDRIIAFAELLELKKALAESHPDPFIPKDKTSKTLSSRRSDSARRSHYLWMSPRKGNHAVTQVLIKWSSLPVEFGTWEDFHVLKQRFPDAPAWGQAGS
jgi:hypothetical protein